MRLVKDKSDVRQMRIVLGLVLLISTMISNISALTKLIKKIKPDVLITYLPHADLLGRIIGRATGVPTIVGSVRVRLTNSKYLPFFIVDGLTSGLVTHYHFNSKTIAKLHRRFLRVNASKITVIPNAIDISKYDIATNPAAKKLELGLDPDKIIIGCIARLRRQKGHHYLIEAFHQVLKHQPNSHLVLVGDGEEKANIVEAINQLGLQRHVTMLGNRHDVPTILPTFDIFALTTLYEGMSNSILEAMAAHRPIVTTNISENQELIEHDVTGLLFPSRNSQATAQAIIELIELPHKRRQLGAAAFQSVKQEFSIESIVPRYRAFYASI